MFSLLAQTTGLWTLLAGLLPKLAQSFLFVTLVQPITILVGITLVLKLIVFAWIVDFNFPCLLGSFSSEIHCVWTCIPGKERWIKCHFSLCHLPHTTFIHSRILKSFVCYSRGFELTQIHSLFTT